jgi:LacI family transcriptional regulator
MFPRPPRGALRSNRSGLVGVISGAISDAAEEPQLSGLPEILIVKGLQDILDGRGCTVLLADTGGRQSRAPQLLRTLAEHRVDGVIYVAPFHQEVRLSLAPMTQRLVLANAYDHAGTPSVVPDDYRGQRDLVAGLIARGHRRIAYLQLPPELDATRHRTRAYRDALGEAGIAHDPAIVVQADVGDGDPALRVATLHNAIVAVLAADPAPTAICCGNDRMAIAVYGMLRTRGLRIPDDISVAGYDDHRLISETLFPTLTTVELPYRAIGSRAAELLMSRPRSRCGTTVPETRSKAVSSTRSSMTSTPASPTGAVGWSRASRRPPTTTPSSRPRWPATCPASSTSTGRSCRTGRGRATCSRSTSTRP